MINHRAINCLAYHCRWCCTFFSANNVLGDPNYHHNTKCIKRPNVTNNQRTINMVNTDSEFIQSFDKEEEGEEVDHDEMYLQYVNSFGNTNNQENNQDGSFMAHLCVYQLGSKDKLISDYKLIFDSGAAISVTNSLVAKHFNLKLFKYKSPIKIVYANNTESYANYFVNFGQVLGVVTIVDDCPITLISTHLLSKRGISYMNEEGIIKLVDRAHITMFIHSINYDISLPKIDITDILQISSQNYNISSVILPAFRDQDESTIMSLTEVQRHRKSNISFQEFKDAVELHINSFHTPFYQIANNIRCGAWTNCKVTASIVEKVDRKYDCPQCALGRWNRPAMQIDTQLPVQYLGTVVSLDNVPITEPTYGGYKGFYLSVEKSVNHLLAFLYKQKDVESITAKIILYYRKYGYDVQVIRTDAGSQECSEAFSNLLAFYRCRIEPAPAEEQYKNPVERFVQYVKNGSSVVLASQSNLGQEFWIFAMLCNVFAWNASVNNLSGDFTPLYHITGNHPDIGTMFKFPFGQKVVVARSKERAADLSLKNETGYVVGHSDYSNNASIVYIPSRMGSKKIFLRFQIAPIKEHPLQSQLEKLSLQDPTLVVDEQSNISVSDISSSVPLELQQANMDMLDEQDLKLLVVQLVYLIVLIYLMITHHLLF